MSDRLACCIGINRYDYLGPLSGCEHDARAIGELLHRNHDKSTSFEIQLLAGRGEPLDRVDLIRHASALFAKPDLEVALLYFAGHGVRNESGAFLAGRDSSDGNEGLPMAQLLSMAARSNAREKVIILDCCHAGDIDRLFASDVPTPLAPGTSVLAAARGTEVAEEVDGRGAFTSRICDALDGGAADVLGNVTVASVYAYVDAVFSMRERQRPVFKANLSRLRALRRAEPAVSHEKLLKIAEYFGDPFELYPLDPSFEPTMEPSHPEHEAIFADLQRFRGARLVVPEGTDHMFFAAAESKACSLTPLGRLHWQRIRGGIA